MSETATATNLGNILRPLALQLTRAFVGHNIQLHATEAGAIRVSVNGAWLPGAYLPQETNLQRRLFSDIRANLRSQGTGQPATPKLSEHQPCPYCGGFHEQDQSKSINRETLIYAIRRNLEGPPHLIVKAIAGDIGVHPYQIHLEGSLPNPTVALTLPLETFKVTYQEALQHKVSGEVLRRVVQFAATPNNQDLTDTIIDLLGSEQVTLEGSSNDFQVEITNADGSISSERFQGWFGTAGDTLSTKLDAQKAVAALGLAAAQRAVNALNEAYQADPLAVYFMLNHRTQCNTLLADHPTVQVAQTSPTGEPIWTVSFLGLLNGALEAATGQRVASRWGDLDSKTEERQFLGFMVYTGQEGERRQRSDGSDID